MVYYCVGELVHTSALIVNIKEPMSQVNRPKPTLYQRKKLKVKAKYAVGTGVISSLAFALILQYSVNSKPTVEAIKMGPVVKVAPTARHQTNVHVFSPASADIEEAEQEIQQLRQAKSPEAKAELAKLESRRAKLKEIEDHQLRLALRAGEEGFDAEILKQKIETLTRSLQPAHQ